MTEPIRCPYCGSIENHSNRCDWCHSDINESEDTPND
jgi:primosomal protein N'